MVLLQAYAARPERQRYNGDNGRIFFERNASQLEFEKAVDQADLAKTDAL